MEVNLETALEALRSNRLRSRLTIAVIAVGITSLVAIQTAIGIMSDEVAGSFGKMGAGMFTVSAAENCPDITLRQALSFASDAAGFARTVSLCRCSDIVARVSCNGTVTDPVVTVMCTDENYLSCRSGAVASGRGIAASDVSMRSSVIVLGDNVRRKLFGEGDGVGSLVTLGSGRYQVVGTLERRGAIFGASLDNTVLIPLTEGEGICIDVVPSSSMDIGEAAECASALFRGIRRLKASSSPDFEIVKSNAAEEGLASIRDKLSVAALAIGLITLLGASVGLMNIMLVSVRERTMEIGLRKSLGAKASDIGRQFLLEAVMIGQAGGAAGIVAGILFGNLAALVMDGNFSVPWGWVLRAVVLCLAVSLLSGLLPAKRAAALDPIAALREE